ncbi:Tn3 family transposase [Streptomyces vinaceus]|uniref:Tn3 family transposase n=1 Tax=Streptomyces vinaceus TaxID=1960 RepID=UPI0036B8E7C8
MTSIERTTHPRFKQLITARELHVLFASGDEERVWAGEVTDSDEHQLALKSHQRMVCCLKWEGVPEQVLELLRRDLELPESTMSVYSSQRTVKGWRSLVRDRCGVRYDGPAARKLAEGTMRIEVTSKNNQADLINIALEKLVEAGLEIPWLSTLGEMASTVIAQANEEIRDRKTKEELRRLLSLPDVIGVDRKTLFNALKRDPRQATWSNCKRLKEHLEWVDWPSDNGKWLDSVASAEVPDATGEAEDQDAATLRDYTEAKRVASISCRAAKARRRARDDIATMLCKRMAAQAKQARDELEKIRRQQQEIMETLVGNYRPLLKQIDAGGSRQIARAKTAAMTKQALNALEDLDEESSPQQVTGRPEGRVSAAFLQLAEGSMVQSHNLASVTAAERFDAQCVQIEKVSVHRGDLSQALLHRHLKADGPVMHDLTDVIELKSTSEDSSLLNALAHANAHRFPARDEAGRPVNTFFATQNWQKVIGDRSRAGYFVRRQFDAMVFYYLAEELRTGDAAVLGSVEYANWSEQLLPWNQVEAKLPEYWVEVGLREASDSPPFDGRALVAQLLKQLSEAAKADSNYPENNQLFINLVSGMPKPRRAEKPRTSAVQLEHEIKLHMTERSLLGIVARTAYWIEWWHRFGPTSGKDPKLKDSFSRYVITTFAKGSNLTFAVAARHIAGITLDELLVAARRHVTTAKLNEAITDVVNSHVRLDMSRRGGHRQHRGSRRPHGHLPGQPVRRDQRPVRAGGRRRLPPQHGPVHRAVHTLVRCGVCEAIDITESLLKNTSDVQPTTIPTPGPEPPVVSLPYLLGIDLMPRFRNWKGLLLFRPSWTASYEHVDALFREPGRNPIGWSLMEARFQDLMRVTVSVREGTVSSTLLLKRFRSDSRRNATHTSFHEVGRAIDTIQLLRSLADAPLWARATAATNKVEAVNGFSDWVPFRRRGTNAANGQVEQEKAVKLTSFWRT